MKSFSKNCVMLFLVLILGSGAKTFANNNSTRVVRDLCGREVTVPGKVERVVALGPGALRFVVYLGVTDKIVGIEDMEKRMVSEQCVRPYAQMLDKSFMKLPVVSAGGPGKLPDFEAVMLANPDIVIVSGLDSAQVENIQKKTGVPAVYITYGEIGVWGKEAQTSLKLLGNILGKSDRANRLVNYVESTERELQKRTKNVEGKPSVYFGGISFKGSHGLTSTQAGYAPGATVNALNVADTLKKAGQSIVDQEQIMVWNPDVIFIDWSSKLIVQRDFQKGPQFYCSLKAVQSERVYSLLPYNHYNTNIELALLNAYFIGKTLYPESFKDVNISEKADDIYQTFLGIDAPDEVPAYHSIHFPQKGDKIKW